MPYRDGDETVTFCGFIKHTTAKAFLVEPTLGGPEVWVPKSQVAHRSDPDETGECEFTVSKWWADKQEGMEW